MTPRLITLAAALQTTTTLSLNAETLRWDAVAAS